jgi:hypothetical protein
MKTRLYTNIWEDGNIEDFNYLTIKINKNFIEYTSLPKNEIEVVGQMYENSKRMFTYHFDNTFTHIFPGICLNTRIKVSHSKIHGLVEDHFEYEDVSSIGGLDGYCHLNTLQRFLLAWSFKNTWLQNPENIKWLISIPLSILTSYITTVLSK